MNSLHPAIIQGPRNWFGAITFRLVGKHPLVDTLQVIPWSANKPV